jgi:hypothetical protein
MKRYIFVFQCNQKSKADSNRIQNNVLCDSSIFCQQTIAPVCGDQPQDHDDEDGFCWEMDGTISTVVSVRVISLKDCAESVSFDQMFQTDLFTH